MSWEDRLIEAKYTAPSGTEIVFGWDAKLSRETALKTGVFTFPDRDGAHVQHQGVGIRTFPMVCIFSGPDCMDEADEFENLLAERDVAELQHPIYGTVKVIPTGNIKREDDLISALNESKVTITFTETITDGSGSATKLDYMSVNEIEQRFASFSDNITADFIDSILTENISEELQFQSMCETQLQMMDESLTPVVVSGVSEMDATAASSGSSGRSSGGSSGSSGTGGNSGTGGGYGSGSISTGTLSSKDKAAQRKNKKMQADFEISKKEYKNQIKSYSEIKDVIAESSIFDKIKSLEKQMQKKIAMARFVLNIMKLPSRMIVNLLEKVKGYTKLIVDLVNQFKNDPFGINNIKNSLISTRLVLSGALASIASGSAIAIVDIGSTGNLTREDSVGIAVSLLELLETVRQFEDTKIVEMKKRNSVTYIGTVSSGSGNPTITLKFEGHITPTTGDKFLIKLNSNTVSGTIVIDDSGTITLNYSNGDTFTASYGSDGISISEANIIFDGDTMPTVVTAAMTRQGGSGENVIDSFIDTNASAYLELIELVYASIQIILNSSLSFSMKRTIILDRDRHVIELCSELYGSPAYMDGFIMENDFNIDEMELLPMGKEVSYYV
jgi:hypothetical protein